MELIIALIVGAGIGYYGRFVQDRLSQKAVLEAKQKRSQAARKGAAKKKAEKETVFHGEQKVTDSSMYGRRVNGSGMVGHE